MGVMRTETDKESMIIGKVMAMEMTRTKRFLNELMRSRVMMLIL